MVHLILDNGGGKLKFGSSEDQQPKVVFTNAAAKINKTMQYLVGDQIDEFSNGSLLNFSRPFDRGYLTNWQCELDVWNRLFSTFQLKPAEHSLILTEPFYNPESIQNDTNEVVYEYFGFKEYMRRPAATFSAYEYLTQGGNKSSALSSCLVIDSGFSFSHAVPFVNGRCQKAHVSDVKTVVLIGVSEHVVDCTGETSQHWGEVADELPERGGQLSPVEHDGRVYAHGSGQGAAVLRCHRLHRGLEARQVAKWPGSAAVQRSLGWPPEEVFRAPRLCRHVQRVPSGRRRAAATRGPGAVDGVGAVLRA